MANALAPRVNTMAVGNALAGRGGELRAWQPGIMDNVRNYAMNALAPLFGGDVRAANAYYRDKIQPTAEYLPGVGDLMAAGEARDAFSAGDYIGGGLLAAGAAAGLVPGVGDVAQKGIKKGIRAYHGSPHDFDKFSMDKIGTGEGAQAYGHGLYFAEAEDVAQGYKQRLANIDAAAADEIGIPPKHWNAFTMFARQADPSQAEAAARDFANWTGSDFTPELVDAYKKTLSNRGRMYEVNINANPDDFLDWDKPYSEQPEAVKRLADQYNLARSASGLKENMGESIYRELGVRVADPANPAFSNARRSGADFAATPVLQEAGIPGIKYLDAGSRSFVEPRINPTDKGFEVYWGNDPTPVDVFPDEASARNAAAQLDTRSRNYVVFDDSLIEILRKYGVLPAAIGTGAFMQMMQDDPEKAQELHNFATSVRDGA